MVKRTEQITTEILNQNLSCHPELVEGCNILNQVTLTPRLHSG